MRVSVNAHLSFGMVNVPVGVSPSTSRQADVSFKTLHLACLAPIKQDKFCSSCGKEHLGPDELCKGFEVVKGEYVTFTESELLALMPERSPLIKIEAFMHDVSLDPLVTQSYWLVPHETFMEPYAVIMDAMGDTGVFGVGTCCLWGKDHLCAVTQTGEAMKLHLLLNPASLVEPDFVLPEPSKEAVELATTWFGRWSRTSRSKSSLRTRTS